MSIRTDYEEYLDKLETKHKKRRSKESFEAPPYLPFFAKGVLKQLFRGIYRWGITYAWLLVIATVVALWMIDERTYSVLFGLVVAAVNIGAIFHEPFRKGCMFVPDYLRRKKRLYVAQQKQKAIEFIEHTGLIKEGEFIKSSVEYMEEEDRYVLHWKDRIRGKTNESIARTLIDFKGNLGAVRAAIPRESKTVDSFDVIYYVKDPLDARQNRKEPASLDVEKMKVECAVDSFGTVVSIVLGGQSGMVVGGLPGSGKTAGVNSFGIPLAQSPHVNLSIIDGKGGDDWSAFAPIADTYLKGDEDLETVVQFLESHVGKMEARIRRLKKSIGKANFWNVSAETRMKAGLKFELLVIDECQGYFDEGGRTKDDRELIGKIKRLVSKIVKLGRSSGYFVILMTQKPTNDSIPTAIRDNCGLRIAFRLKKPAAEEAVLGEVDSEVRATDIPESRLGGAVLALESGQIEPVRFFYIEEEVQEKLLLKEGLSRGYVVPNEDDEGYGSNGGDVDIDDMEAEEEDGDFHWEEVEAR